MSTHDGLTKSIDQFSYPLYVNYTALDPGSNSCRSPKSSQYPSGINPPSFTGMTTFDHSYERLFAPSPFVLTSNIRAHQTAGGYLVRSPNGNTGNGTNENQFSYNDAKGNTYWRTVNAAYNNITYDREGGNLAHGRTHLWDPAYVGPQRVADHEDSFRLPGGRYGN